MWSAKHLCVLTPHTTVLQHVAESLDSNYLHRHNVHGELASGRYCHHHRRFLLSVCRLL